MAMIAPAAPPQPYKSFGQGQPQQVATTMPGAPPMMPPPRVPPPNMFPPPGFNQFKQINIPPPNMVPPMPMSADVTQSVVPGVFPQPFGANQQGIDFDARRQQRRNLQRRTVDYNASVVQQIKVMVVHMHKVLFNGLVFPCFYAYALVNISVSHFTYVIFCIE